MKTARQAILFLFYAFLDMDLLSPALCQRVPHQACVYALPPEFELEVNIFSDLPGLLGAHSLRQYHMDKDKRSIRIPFPVEHPSPLRNQDCSKPAPHLPWGCGVPAS